MQISSRRTHQNTPSLQLYNMVIIGHLKIVWRLPVDDSEIEDPWKVETIENPWNTSLPTPHLACNSTNRCTDTGRLALQDALKGQPCQHGWGRSHESGGHCTGCHSICDGQSRTAVESQPAEPKEATAQDHERDVGRAQILLHVPAWSKDATSNKAGHTGADVNHSSTCEVKSSHLTNPAARAPNPVAQRCVDQKGPQSKHDAVSTETHALHQRARNDCRRNDGKGHLEGSEHKAWKTRVTPHLHVQTHPQAVVKVANEHAESGGTIVTEGPWKAKHHPSQCDDSHGDYAHHHGVDDVGVTHQATIEEAKPCRHQEHECRWGQDPSNCAWAHGIVRQSWVGHCFGWRKYNADALAWRKNKIGFEKKSFAHSYGMQHGKREKIHPKICILYIYIYIHTSVIFIQCKLLWIRSFQLKSKAWLPGFCGCRTVFLDATQCSELPRQTPSWTTKIVQNCSDLSKHGEPSGMHPSNYHSTWPVWKKQIVLISFKTQDTPETKRFGSNWKLLLEYALICFDWRLEGSRCIEFQASPDSHEASWSPTIFNLRDLIIWSLAFFGDRALLGSSRRARLRSCAWQRVSNRPDALQTSSGISIRGLSDAKFDQAMSSNTSKLIQIVPREPVWRNLVLQWAVG